MVNPIGAGFLAGGILARNAGPKAAFGGGIAFAAFSAAIDLFLRRETAELVPLITIAFLITHANQIIARIEVASILFALYRLIFIVGYHTLYSNLTHYLSRSTPFSTMLSHSYIGLLNIPIPTKLWLWHNKPRCQGLLHLCIDWEVYVS